MKEKMKNKLKNYFKRISVFSDSYLIFIYFIILIIGIWHAFPNLKIVGDEAPFVGGVLRAMQDRTLLPNIDYSYTLSFYANYLLMIPFVLIGLLLFGGNTAMLTKFLMENVYLAYFIPRLLSVGSAMIILALFLSMMRKRGKSFKERLVVSSIVFGNIIFLVIAHTGKMWMFSLLLWFISFYFFDKAISEVIQPDEVFYKSPYFWSPIFAFLAFANFPINVIALIFVAWLWLHAWINKLPYKALLAGTILGASFFVVLFLLNQDGWLIQNSITPVGERNLLGIFSYFLYGALILMPLHILYLLFCTKIKLSTPVKALIVSLCAYVILVGWRASWIGSLSEGYWRYFVYITFIAGVMFLYFETRRRSISLILALISVCFLLRVDYLLSIPTTYNEARDYLVENNSQLVVNYDPYLDLPKNQNSYLLTENSLCQSRCLFGRLSHENKSKLFVIDSETKTSEFERVFKDSNSYLLVTGIEQSTNSPLIVFSNGLKKEEEMGVDNNLGPYLIDLFKVERFGPELFIYKN